MVYGWQVLTKQILWVWRQEIDQPPIIGYLFHPIWILFCWSVSDNRVCIVFCGYGYRAVDIFAAAAGDALDGVALVVICLDQTGTGFVEQCLSRKIGYVDISADYSFLSEVEKLDDLAKRNGVTAMLSVGVAPGLTNMLAARARERMERVDRIDRPT